jgi:hypothetical protein
MAANKSEKTEAEFSQKGFTPGATPAEPPPPARPPAAGGVVDLFGRVQQPPPSAERGGKTPEAGD